MYMNYYLHFLQGHDIDPIEANDNVFVRELPMRDTWYVGKSYPIENGEAWVTIEVDTHLPISAKPTLTTSRNDRHGVITATVRAGGTFVMGFPIELG